MKSVHRISHLPVGFSRWISQFGFEHFSTTAEQKADMGAHLDTAPEKRWETERGCVRCTSRSDWRERHIEVVSPRLGIRGCCCWSFGDRSSRKLFCLSWPAMLITPTVHPMR